MDYNSHILIIGMSQEDVYKFILSLIPYFKDNNDGIIQEIKESLVNDEYVSVPICYKNQLNIETKYYSAYTKIWNATYNEILVQETEKYIDKLKEEQFINEFEAIFFLMKVENKKIIGSKEYAQVCDQFNDSFFPQSQAIVINMQKDQDYEIDEFQVNTKNVQSFVEQIFEDIDLLSKSKEIVKPKVTLPNTESDGITRVVEILECNPWKTAIMKELKKKLVQVENNNQQQSEIQLKVNKDESIKQADNQPVIQQQSEVENKKQEAMIIQTPSIELNEKKIFTTNKNKAKEVVEEEIKMPLDSQEKKEVQKVNIDDAIQLLEDDYDEQDQQGENELDSFVKIVQQMKEMRQQSANIPDEDRKKRAENLINSLIKDLNIFGEEDLEDEIVQEAKESVDKKK